MLRLLVMLKNISKDFKIFLLAILACGALIGLVYVADYLSYTHLINAAKTLPNYHNSNLSNGIRGERECYPPDGRVACKALIMYMDESHDKNAETKKFISELQKEGVEWYEYKDGDVSIDSKVFARNGRNHQVYILHDTSGITSVSLLEY